MLADGRQVGHAGDVAAGARRIGDQLGADRVGHGGEDDRDVPGRGRHGLGRRRRDGDDHVRAFADEFAGDLGGGGGVALRALILEAQVLSDLVAVRLELVADAVPCGVERRMLDDCGHCDERFLLGRGGAAGHKRAGGDGQQRPRNLAHTNLPGVRAGRCCVLSVTPCRGASPPSSEGAVGRGGG